MRSNETGLSGRDWLMMSVVVAAGVLVAFVLLLRGLAGASGEIIEAGAPGRTEVTLPATGPYTIYEQFQLTQDSRGQLRPGGADELVLTLTDAAGTAVPLTGAKGAASYRLGRTRGESLYQFEAPAGAYVLDAISPEDAAANAYTLAIRASYGSALRWSLFYAALSALATLAVVLFLSRQIHRRAPNPEHP